MEGNNYRPRETPISPLPGWKVFRNPQMHRRGEGKAEEGQT